MLLVYESWPAPVWWVFSSMAGCVMWSRFFMTVANVLFAVPGAIFLDLVHCVVTRLSRERSPEDLDEVPFKSFHWWWQTCSVWMLLLVPQVPLWHRLLVEPPLAVTRGVLDLVFILHEFVIIRVCYSEESRRARLLDRFLGELDMDQLEQHVERWNGRSLYCFHLDMMVLSLEWEDLASTSPRLPLLLLTWQALKPVLSFYNNPFRKLLQQMQGKEFPWTLSPMPLHTGALSSDCPIHDSCSICLENLCYTPPPCESMQSQGGDAQPSQMALSACRARPRRRSASPGISAIRSGPRCCPPEAGPPQCLIVPKGMYIATLRCGHRFHHECLVASRRKRSSCPTCRASFVEQSAVEKATIEKAAAQKVEKCLLWVVGTLSMLLLLLLCFACTGSKGPRFRAIFQTAALPLDVSSEVLAE
mmetsp:Transcript_54212/g.129178  ORF Transcript_54212/g.129178 Transcript_54212/m.129178 type:complete len:417 (-) Transcript_54212:24-1274(-)